MKLRIAQVMPFYAWTFGGSVEQARGIDRELAARGHAVSVFTSDLGCDADVPRDAWHAVDGYRVFCARARGLARFAPYPAPAALRRELRRALAAGAIDVVATQVGLTLLNGAALARCARYGVPFVYAAQGALSAARLRQRRLAKAMFLPSFERFVLRRATALQAVSDAEVDEMLAQGAPRERIHVIRNGIDPDAWSSGDGAAMRRAFGIPSDARVFGFVGRIAPEKGLDLWIDAIASFAHSAAKSSLTTRFLIAGPDGGIAAALRARVARHGLGELVHFGAAVPRADMAAALAALDVFVLPSRAEGLPLAALEAGAAGRCLLVTTGCHLPEVARVDAGLEVAPTVQELAAALRELAETPSSELRARGARAAKMVRDRFTIAHTVDALERLYADLHARAAR